jgi:hypothetical protein
MPTEHDRYVEAVAVALLILLGFTVMLIGTPVGLLRAAP